MLLKEYLDESVERNQKDAIEPVGTKEESNPSTLQDMIKNYTEESETKPVDDIIEYFELDQNNGNKSKT